MSLDSNMEMYRYEPLPTPTSIRLLRLGEKDELGRFHCMLKTVDLNDSPWYHAFSYTWGNPHAEARETHPFTKNYDALNPEYALEGRKYIMCDGKNICISRNIYDAFCDVPKDAWMRFINRKREPEGWSKLHVCVNDGKHNEVRQLLHSGIDLDIVDNDGNTALNLAVQMGDLEMSTLLAQAGAKIDISNNVNQTALDIAHKRKHAEIARCLENISHKLNDLSLLDATGEGPEVWAWIDQICINQEDLQERSSQVEIMDEIYRKSTFTVTWLGREDRYTKAAVSVIDKLYPAQDRFVKSDIMPYSDNSEEVYRNAGLAYISSDEWDSLASIFQRQYFRRLWIVQEIVFSNNVLVYCGSLEISWKRLGVVAQLLLQRQHRIGHKVSAIYVPLNEAARSIESSVEMLVGWTDQWTNGPKTENPKKVNQETLIYDTWHFRATDPKDKIYGLYGLLRQKDTGHHDWTVDYRKPVEKLYAEATKRILGDAGGLQFLSCVIDQSRRSLTSLPSWVPDYSLPYATARFRFNNAAGKLPIPSPIFTQSGPWNELGVRGTHIGSALRTGSTTRRAGDPRAFFDPSWLELALLIPSTYHHTGESRTEALWRTLCGDKDTNDCSPAPVSYGAQFSEVISKMMVRSAWIEAIFTAENPGCGLSPSLKDAVQKNLLGWSKPPLSDMTVEFFERMFSMEDNRLSDENHQSLVYTLGKLHVLSMAEGNKAWTPTLEHLLEVEETLMDDEDPARLFSDARRSFRDPPQAIPDFLRVSSHTISRMRLFVTEDRFIGLGPAAMKAGDTLWILPGAGAMFILRKLGVCNTVAEDDKTAGHQKHGDEDGNSQTASERRKEQGKIDQPIYDDTSDTAEDAGEDRSRRRYTFIGEAYLHGCMNGEAVDGKDVKFENIILV